MGETWIPVTLREGNQITLPRVLCKLWKLQLGDRLEVIVRRRET